MTRHISGFRDWVMQRITALVIGSYAIFFVLYLMLQAPITYTDWHHLFSLTMIRLWSLLVLISVLWHAWIGLWTIFTDYIKCYPLRLVLEAGLILLLMVLLGWGFYILFFS